MTNQSPDFNVLLDIQHKNMAALAQAQKLAVEGFVTAWLRQTETLAQIAGLTSSLVTKSGDGQTPGAKIENWADMAGKIYDQSIMNWTGQNAIIGQSNKAAADVIHNRVNSSLVELQHAVKKHTGNHSRPGRKKAA
jgi:hypothetical protein